jgi:hypothetical protein
MGAASFKNIGQFFSCRRSVSANAVAAGAGDNTETDGATVDRYVNGSNGAAGIFMSATFFLQAQAVLGTTETCKYKATLQESDASGSGFADVAAALQPAGAADSLVLTLTDPGGGSTQVGIYQLDVNLESLKRYIRAQVHHDLSRGATDTSFYCAGFVMGGVSEGPLAVT